MIDMPHCGNCGRSQVDCPLDNTPISKVSQQSLIVKTVGCLFHPNSREWLMQDVIKELKMRVQQNEQKANDVDVLSHMHTGLIGRTIGLRRAISLIENGVKKK